LVSATALVDNRSHATFDASRPGAPLAYRDAEANLLATQETRLSRTRPDGSSWVLGFALLRDRNAQDRELAGGGDPVEIIGVTNVARSASIFSEATRAVLPRLLVTLGLRGTLARNEADPSFMPRGASFFTGQETHRLDPTLAITYAGTGGLSLYARYQSGFRTGGLAVARGVGRVAAYTPDSIAMGELGLRFAHRGAHPLQLSAAYSHAAWDNIQADLIDRRGSPYTANIGSARIDTVELTAGWQPLNGLTASASTVYTGNVVHGPLADTSIASNRRLPQTPSFAGDGALDYAWDMRAGRMRVGATLSYVGRAVLGPGDLFDVGHSPYTLLGASAGWQRGRMTVTLSADNLLDARNDRFPFGNPFMLADRSMVTPLRPATARLATELRW
jgi:iron complex outermembrane recepter protein